MLFTRKYLQKKLNTDSYESSSETDLVKLDRSLMFTNWKLWNWHLLKKPTFTEKILNLKIHFLCREFSFPTYTSLERI